MAPVVSLLLCTIILEILSREIRPGFLEELLYAEDLTLVSEIFQGLKSRLKAWKGAVESEGLTVNVKTTKILISNENTGKVTMEDKFP